MHRLSNSKRNLCSIMHNLTTSFLLFVLMSRLIIVESIMPVIHSISLQNDTSIPEDYKDLPLVGKCCPTNRILILNKDQNRKCIPSNTSELIFSPPFYEYNSSGIWLPGNERKRFVALVGEPCHTKRVLVIQQNDQEEDHYLLLNGSISLPDSVPRILMPGQDYCMEITPTLGLIIVMCFPKDNKILMADARIIFYACGLLISVPFLILTIIAFSITPRLRDIYGKILCHYCGCLALAFTGLAITQLGGVHWEGHTCICIAFVIEFSFVACYFWLNVMCIETWLLIRNHVHHVAYQRIKPNVLFFYYSIWAWGSSGIFILLSIIMDLNPTIPMIYIKPNDISENDNCWFKPDIKTMPFFFVPVGLLLLVNLIFFILTGTTIRRYQKDLSLRRLARNLESDRQDQRMFHSLKRTFIVCIVLYSLMSLTWTMELISWFTGGNPFDWSVYDLVNALQGLLVFGLFVLRRPARDFIWYRIQRFRGIDVVEPQPDTAVFSLLTVIN
ncbi:G-protein coupled receptor Mth2-like [Vespa crabro]|uniref:G-protein coupled receptor Mth2-like n=1 Tax=Vespa crabro TaxID=7445 RepID=UPI001EFFACE3|nr:G-protein coupled receptor Mth2-like [Vespa crabro]XP_046820461.1 G-protein coupled receptor Mth2-like [Vespa crabro]XP_046820462.1 G-protein coupled receptor Mth2-like [Vespa crabro]XP_046820463.1 G-protein coupled receptor Mth2-like [Vespa crabro]